jgi:hypothetical protein
MDHFPSVPKRTSARERGRGELVPDERVHWALFLALASVSFLLSLILLFLSAPPSPRPIEDLAQSHCPLRHGS